VLAPERKGRQAETAQRHQQTATKDGMKEALGNELFAATIYMTILLLSCC